MTRRIARTLFGTPRRSAATAIVACISVSVLYGTLPVVREVAAWLSLPMLGTLGLAYKFPNEAKQVVGRLLAHFTFLGGPVERESIRQDVEGTLSAGLVALSRATPTTIPSKVRLEFLRTGNDVAKLRDGTVIIGIAPHSDRTRNLVAAAWVFSQNAVIPHARPHLDADVSRGIDFTVTKSLLAKADLQAVTEFIKSIWLPSIRDERRVRELTDKLETLEDDQLLAPVLLEEFGDLGIRRANRFPQEEVAEETAAFVEHLFALATGQTIASGPHFDGRHIRASFVLMATADVMAVRGEVAYREAIEWAIRAAYPRIYVIAKGTHIDHARSVCDLFAADARIRGVREYACTVDGHRGEPVGRLVTQIRVDVRQYVGIGQRPVVAVGPRFDVASRDRRKRSRARRSA